MKPLYVYNSNDPKLSAVLKTYDIIITNAQYKLIQEICEPGPYVAFFQDVPENRYRFRGPFRDKNMCGFYVLDCMDLAHTDEIGKIHDLVVKNAKKKSSKEENS